MSLLKNETYLECENPNIYAIVVSDEDQTQLLISYYDEDDDTSDEDVELRFYADKDGEILFYLTGAEKNREQVRTIKTIQGELNIKLSMKLLDIESLHPPHLVCYLAVFINT